MPAFNDFTFSWSSVIITLLFLMFISISMFTLTKEKSYKYYILYAVFTLFSLLIRFFITEEYSLQKIPDHVLAKLSSSYYLLDVCLFLFYTIFTIYFLDLADTAQKKIILLVKKYSLKAIIVVFVVFSVVFIFGKHQAMETIHHVIFAPYLILQAFIISYVALKNRNQIRSVFIFGLLVFISLSIFSFVLDLMNQKFLFSDNSIYFFIGAIIENACFAVGIAFKFKNNIEQVETHKRDAQANLLNKEIEHLKGVVEGEKALLSKMSANYNKNVLRMLSKSLVFFEKEVKVNANSKNLEHGINALQEAIYSIADLKRYFPTTDTNDVSFLDRLRRLAFFFCKHNYEIENEYGEFQFSENAYFVLLKILEEFLENVKEHAKAEKVLIIFDKIEANLVLIVKDDGIGFQEVKQLEGIGLSSVQTIVDALSGKVSIFSSPKGGTTVEVHLPLNELEYLR